MGLGGALPGVYNNMARGIVALVFGCRPVGTIESTDHEAVRFEWLDRAQTGERMSEAYAVRLVDALDRSDCHTAVRAHDGVHVTA